MLNQLADRKFSLYVDHMQQHLPKNDVPMDVVNAIVFLLRLFRVIEVRDAKMMKTLAAKRKAVETAIKEKYKIRI